MIFQPIMKRLILPVAFFTSILVSAQTYNVKVLTWNILNWPSTSAIASDTATRCPAFRSVLGYAMPDIIMTCENNGSVGLNWFRDQVLNSLSTNHYALGTFVNGYDTDNALYYRDSLFRFVSNVPITTALRDINQFTLVFKATGDTLILYMCHLKAGTGYESNRTAEVMNLRAVTNSFTPGKNFLIGGDYNVYADTESAYQNLLLDNIGDDGNFVDVIPNMSGVWNYWGYARYHTQSTRVVAGPGGGSTGGMDDRFDMILMSNGIMQNGGVYYLPGSYTNIGNDGNHYNKAINYQPNTAVSPTVADALLNTSDHLPVMVTLQMSGTADLTSIESPISNLVVYPQPISAQSVISYSLRQKAQVTLIVTDLAGRIIWEGERGLQPSGEHTESLESAYLISNGFYLLSLKVDNQLITKKISILN